MKTNEITKREELCELLNMNFDEAGELFSDETMHSMQMAKVNGGEPITLTVLGVTFLVGVASGVVAAWLYDCLKGEKTVPTTPQGGFSFDSNQGLLYQGQPVDSVNMYLPSGEFSWKKKNE